MDPEEFRARLEELTSGFTYSQILFTALRANLFTYLEGSVKAEDVARELGWSPRGTRMLLDGLVALGLVEKFDGDYCNAPIAAHCLIPGGPDDQTNIIIHKAHGWDNWGRLGEAVKSGESLRKPGHKRSPEELRAFILGMADIGRSSAKTVLDAVDFSPYRHILDVGGGPATYPITFLGAHSEMRATVFDTPDVIPISREEVEKAGMLDRFNFVAGDLTRDNFGSGYDVVFISNIIHMLSDDVNRDLVKRACAALEPGGMLIIKDFLTDKDHTGPPFSLLFALQMLLHTQGGDTYSVDEVSVWTREAGFGEGRLVDITPQTRLWLAPKPA